MFQYLRGIAVIAAAVVNCSFASAEPDYLSTNATMPVHHSTFGNCGHFAPHGSFILCSNLLRALGTQFIEPIDLGYFFSSSSQCKYQA